ncbi:MAG: exonuclease SbcCD subunit D [Marinilabiliales bacterium]|nr:exonuclease SbcCD subunit D [Marinilabiliales bacterium]
MVHRYLLPGHLPLQAGAPRERRFHAPVDGLRLLRGRPGIPGILEALPGPVPEGREVPFPGSRLPAGPGRSPGPAAGRRRPPGRRGTRGGPEGRGGDRSRVGRALRSAAPRSRPAALGMRILHASDLHLGKTLHERDLLADQAGMLDQLRAAVAEHRPAALVIAGDVNDKAVPPPQAVSLFGGFLGRLKSEHPDLVVLAIPGNHDSPARLGFGDSIFRRAGVHLRVRAEEAGEPVVLERDGRAALSLGPALSGRREPSRTPPLPVRPLPGGPGPDPAEASRDDGANVLVCHAYAAGGRTSDSERVFLGTAELVDAAGFDPFDYAALGHLHRSQKAGRKGLYPGSPPGYSFSEAGQDKGFLLVDVRRGASRRQPSPSGRSIPCPGSRGPYASFLAGRGTARDGTTTWRSCSRIPSPWSPPWSPSAGSSRTSCPCARGPSSPGRTSPLALIPRPGRPSQGGGGGGPGGFLLLPPGRQGRGPGRPCNRAVPGTPCGGRRCDPVGSCWPTSAPTGEPWRSTSTAWGTSSWSAARPAPGSPASSTP